MAYVVLAIAAAICFLCIRLTGLVDRTKAIATDTQRTVAMMRAPDIDDHDKERAVKRASLRMFGAFGVIVLQTAAVIGVPMLFVLVVTMTDRPALAEIEATATGWPFILGATAAMILLWRFIR